MSLARALPILSALLAFSRVAGGIVALDTIRFYEKLGLLDSSNTRGENKYRHYGEEAISRLEFIIQGKALGLTLSEIKRVIDEQDKLLLHEKVHLIRNKITQMDERINQLQGFKQSLLEKIKRLEAEDKV